MLSLCRRIFQIPSQGWAGEDILYDKQRINEAHSNGKTIEIDRTKLSISST